MIGMFGVAKTDRESGYTELLMRELEALTILLYSFSPHLMSSHLISSQALR